MFEAILLFLNSLIYTVGYFGVFILMAIESSFIPFPSEIIMIPAGYLASIGKFNFWLVVLFGVLGSIAGAVINYMIGKYLGRVYLLSHSKMFFIKKESLLKADVYFKEHGGKTTFIGRLIPVVRQYISLPAGFANMHFGKFVFFTALGSFVWVFFLTTLGFFIGEQLSSSIINYYNLIIIAVIAISAIAVGYIYTKKKLKI